MKKFKNVCQHTKDGEKACAKCRFPFSYALMNKTPFFNNVSKITLVDHYDDFIRVAEKYIVEVSKRYPY